MGEKRNREISPTFIGELKLSTPLGGETESKKKSEKVRASPSKKTGFYSVGDGISRGKFKKKKAKRPSGRRKRSPTSTAPAGLVADDLGGGKRVDDCG